MYKIEDSKKYLDKWQEILSLKDWTIKIKEVDKEWRKSGDIKIDSDNMQAILMLNTYNPKRNNLEALIVHELLHLKLWGMDQMIEELINTVFGQDPSDPKYQFAFRKFMGVLEPTVEHLALAYMSLGGDDMSESFSRLDLQVKEEIGEE